MKRTTLLIAALAAFALAAPLTSCTNDDEEQEIDDSKAIASQRITYSITVDLGGNGKLSIADIADITIHLVDNNDTEKTATLQNGVATIDFTQTAFPYSAQFYTTATPKAGAVVDPEALYLSSVEVTRKVVTNYKKGSPGTNSKSDTFSQSIKGERVLEYIGKWEKRFTFNVELDENGVNQTANSSISD